MNPDPDIVLACVRIYRPSFGHENDRFPENKLKTLIFNPIRTQRHWYQLVLDKIRRGGIFQILGLRRGRDQLVFTPLPLPLPPARPCLVADNYCCVSTEANDMKGRRLKCTEIKLDFAVTDNANCSNSLIG